MRILILNWKDIKHPQVGGAEIIVYELAKRLVNKGHKVEWFCRSFNGAKSEETIEGIKIIRKGNLVTTYILAPLYYWSLQEKPDLVIDMSNTIFWQTTLWVHKVKKIAYLNQLAKEVFDYEYPLIIAKLGKLIERIQYVTYKNIPFVCYSNSTKEDLIDMGVPAKNINIFPLGLDHKRYKPGKKANYPLFLSVSRLVKMKRTDLVIRAFRGVADKYPEAKLAIVGYGYDRKRLQEIRDSLDLQKNVFFVDKDNLYFEKSVKDQKVKLMQEAWALVSPSVKEGWMMTVTECAACGTPAIVSDTSGVRDSVQKDKTGLILSKNPDPEEITVAMRRLIEDKKLRVKLSQNAKKWANNFTWDRSFREFEKIIREVVNQK